MNKEFIPYEEALALKKLGFDELCIASYDDEGQFKDPFDYISDDGGYLTNSSLMDPNNFNAYSNPRLLKEYLDKPFTAAPLYQQAFRWFREKYMLKGDVNHADSNGSNKITIWKWNYDNNVGAWERLTIIGTYTTYEKAELECLKQLIKIVNEKEKD